MQAVGVCNARWPGQRVHCLSGLQLATPALRPLRNTKLMLSFALQSIVLQSIGSPVWLTTVAYLCMVLNAIPGYLVRPDCR